MKKISFILLLFITTITFSQNYLDEVVYLKNGSVIRGIIIEQIPNQTLKIQTKNGSVFVYNFSEVQKITKEASFVNSSTNQQIQTTGTLIQNNQIVNQNKFEIIDTANNTSKNSYTYNTPADKKIYLKKGFIGVTEIGALFKSKKSYFYADRFSSFSFNQLIGKRTSQTFSIGIAFGVDVNKYLITVPTTLDMRIYFMRNRVTPFLNLAPGYALLHYNKYMGYKSYVYAENFHSFISNFGLGVEFKINKSLGVSLNVGGRLIFIPRQGVEDVGGKGFLKFGIVY